MAETASILQFGAGRFLRAFADLFVHEANDTGQDVGRIVVVQSTGSERARLLNAQRGRYHVLIRGFESGQVVDRAEQVCSISRALVAAEEWPAVLELGRSPELRTILSNTTEAGLALDARDGPADAPPRSYPAKLLQVLRARWEAGLPGVLVLACELVDRNGGRVRELVLQQAEAWGWAGEFTTWLREQCAWPVTLVDRIVAAPPAEHPLLTEDGLLCVTEPFALWAVEDRLECHPLFEHPAVRVVPDVQPYALRKVRLLNGAHTALVTQALPRGFVTVREAVADPELRAWLEALLFQEIVPTLEGRVEGAEAFARTVLERFANPFLEHRLADIALHQETKARVRLMPTQQEFVKRFGRRPVLLDNVLEGILESDRTG